MSTQANDKSGANTVLLQQDPNSVVGLVMLTPVFVGLAEAIRGRPAAELMAELTGLTPQFFRRRLALPRRPKKRAQALQEVSRRITEALVGAGLNPAEAQRRAQERPDGLLECAMYDLGYCSDRLHPAGLAELRRLDDIDLQIGQFIHARDLNGLWAWLGAANGPDERLSRSLFVSGVASRPENEAEPSLENVRARLGNLLAQQLLSFLAVMDHEVRPVVALSAWDGYSLLATLIAPSLEARLRPHLFSPSALLIDRVAASGMADSEGRLPDRRPLPSEVEKWMSCRGRGGAGLAERIHRLRRGQTKLTGNTFKAFVREIRHRPVSQNQTLEDEARMLFPLLVAAHLLSMLMPKISGTPHHDRRGWREAYLDWWDHHAAARGVPIELAGTPGPPEWITFGQSSLSLQSSGRSS